MFSTWKLFCLSVSARRLSKSTSSPNPPLHSGLRIGLAYRTARPRRVFNGVSSRYRPRASQGRTQSALPISRPLRQRAKERVGHVSISPRYRVGTTTMEAHLPGKKLSKAREVVAAALRSHLLLRHDLEALVSILAVLIGHAVLESLRTSSEALAHLKTASTIAMLPKETTFSTPDSTEYLPDNGPCDPYKITISGKLRYVGCPPMRMINPHIFCDKVFLLLSSN